MSWRQATNKSAPKPAAPKPKFETKDDDWETDITYENSATEKSQRFGSTSVPGSGRIDYVDLGSIQDKVKSADNTIKETYQEKNPNRGYGGKYGTEQVMDKSAADFSYKADVKKHSSQTDSKKGFGGEHGIDERAKDKSAVGFDYKATVEKHSSQTDFVKGFGGKYGVDQNAQDKSAVGFSHKETLTKHSSQTDYTAGFGGKHGVQKEESTGSSAVVGPSSPKPPPPAEPKVVEKPAIVPTAKADVGNIRARFENMRKEQESESAKRVAEERKKRANAEQRKAQPKGDDHEKNTQHEIVVVTKESNREPSPVRPKTPTESELSTSNIPENNENNTETVTSITNEAIEEHTEKFVGGINITSLLRPRKTSSSSSKKDDDDDDNEWAVENDENNQQADE